MSRTVNVNEEFVVVSEGKKDIGKFAVLGNDGKFDTSVIPEIESLQEQITKEVSERTEVDKELQKQIEAEAADRTEADINLQNAISEEIASRETVDKDLQDQLNKEVADRNIGDTALQVKIEVEAATRIAADSNLQANIDTEADSRIKADQDLQSKLDNEINARSNGDQSEESERTEADKNLQTQIDALKAATFDTGHSFADNGYQSLGNGLVLQWGHAQLSKGGYTGSVAVNFPTPFPNKCLSFATTYDNSPQKGWGPMSTAIGKVTKNGCTLWGDADGHNIDNDVNIYYIAIGY